jgi:hypothetical protein
VMPVGRFLWAIHTSCFDLFSESAKRKSRDIYADQIARIEKMEGVTVLRPRAVDQNVQDDDPQKG